VIVLEHVAKTFVSRGGEEVAALADASLQARRNEFVCLVGPSGCGKSTLLGLVAGLVAPTAGTISIAGSAVTEPRAGICRALVHEPDILLMDEPFGALDALTREELTIEVMRIWRERPKTILFVTHSIPEAVLLADRVVVMSARPGRVAEIVEVHLPRPRDFDMEARREFQQATHRIRELIFGARHARAG
jgi:ABC-type nitrate/sulfonate/bicarbonate transport system ATPase subunit